MFIQTEKTPNPATLKFIPGMPVLRKGGAAEFRRVEDAGASPLAQNLFSIAGVDGVFLGADFISVTKAADHEWENLKTLVLAEIMQHFVSGLPAMEEGNGGEKAVHEQDDELSKQIRELIDQRVRPAVANDGGDIDFVKFEDGIVYLRLRGACAGCPSSTVTLKSGIENMLKHYVPEVIAVEEA